MQQKTILIAGCGDVGSKLGQQLLQQGHNVVGLRRNINQLPRGIQGISADLGQLETLQQALSNIQQCDILVYSAAASQHDEAGYRAAYVEGMHNLLQTLPVTPQHLFFTSSSGVYHQNDHSWVDETSPCQPQSFSGRIMLEAEQQALQSTIPATVVRFSGIYGPGRNHLLNRVRRGDVAPEEPLQFSNRIHRDDCAGVLHHLIQRKLNGDRLHDCYLASDDEPAAMHEVTHWMARELGCDIVSSSASRRAGSKRCSNQRLKESGYQFIYPDFRSGYQELIHGQ